MKKPDEGFVRAHYRWVPCTYNRVTDEIRTQRWWWSALVWLLIYWDIYIMNTDEFPLWIELSDFEKEELKRESQNFKNDKLSKIIQ